MPSLIRAKFSMTARRVMVIKINHDLVPFFRHHGFQPKITHDGEGYAFDLECRDNDSVIVIKRGSDDERRSLPSTSKQRDSFVFKAHREWMNDFPLTSVNRPARDVPVILNDLEGSIVVELPPALSPNSIASLRAQVGKLSEIIDERRSLAAKDAELTAKEAEITEKIQRMASQLQPPERTLVDLPLPRIAAAGEDE